MILSHKPLQTLSGSSCLLLHLVLLRPLALPPRKPMVTTLHRKGLLTSKSSSASTRMLAVTSVVRTILLKVTLQARMLVVTSLTSSTLTHRLVVSMLSQLFRKRSGALASPFALLPRMGVDHSPRSLTIPA